MDRIRSQLRTFAADQNGATAIEYCMIASLISIVIVAGATSIGQSVKTMLAKVATGL